MKKFNILFISAIVILFIGCSTEMRIEEFNVEVEDDTFYLGCAFNLNDHFFVTYTDSNNTTTVLSAGEYAYSGIDVSKTGYQDVEIFCSSPSGYYEPSTSLKRTVRINVVQPEIQPGTLTLATGGTLVKGISIKENMKNGNFAATISYKVEGDTLNRTYGAVTNVITALWDNPWSITGYDASTDVTGKINLIGHYGDLTTDPVPVWVVD